MALLEEHLHLVHCSQQPAEMARHHRLEQRVAPGQPHPVYAGHLLLLAVVAVVAAAVAMAVVVVGGLGLHTAMVEQVAMAMAVAAEVAVAVAAVGQGLGGLDHLAEAAVEAAALEVSAVPVLDHLAEAVVVAVVVGLLMAVMAAAHSEEHRLEQHHGRVARHLTGPGAAVAEAQGAC